jgi:membrane protease YdiL (CAAX protease family)
MTFVGAAMMFAPSLAVLGVYLRRRRREGAGSFGALARRTGLTLGPNRRRTLGLMLLGWVAPPFLVGLSTALAVAIGVLDVDLESFSLLRERLGYEPREVLPMAATQLLLVVVLQSVTVSALLTMVFAWGEEWGWRGWLLPRLVSRWGVTGGLVVSGVIWGLWHFPATLRGYNFPELGAWAAVFFIVSCILLAIPLGWLRLVSGSVWPAVVAHGALNATTGLVDFVGDAAEPPVMHLAGLSGITGWMILAPLSLLCLRHLRSLQVLSDVADEDVPSAATGSVAST